MNVSFFKLPLVLAVICWLMGYVFSIAMMAIRSLEHIELAAFVINILMHSLFYGLPKFLLIIFTASLALYRCRVHQLTAKNILALIVVSLIINAISILFNTYIVSFMWGYLYQNFTYDHTIFFISYHIVINLINCILAGALSYYTILSLQGIFDSDLNTHAITADSSAKIHLTLFLILFMFIYLLFVIPLVSYMGYGYYSFEYQYTITITYLMTIAIAVLILYFAVRRCFNQAFETIQTSRVVKSSILSFVFSAIVNFMITVGMIVFIFIATYGSHRNDDLTITLILLLSFIVQLALTCFVLRAVTRRYFGRAGNEILVS